MSRYYNGCEYYGIDMPFHEAHNNINSALHWWEAEKGVEPEMALYSNGARQSQDLRIPPSQMDWTTHVRITDHATTGVIQRNAN